MAAFKMAKDHPEAQAEVEAATKKATLIPLEVAERAREVRQIIESLRPMTNPRMASDLTVAAAQANAAIQGALANVEINLGDIKDKAFLDDVGRRVAALRS
jgi:formiminotetrahydrofolate cyclodeaminase